MRHGHRYANLAILGVGVLAVAGLVMGLLGRPNPDLVPGFYRGWWLISAALAAAAGAGMVLHRRWGFYLAVIGLPWGAPAIGLVSLGADHPMIGVALVLYSVALGLAFKRGWPWLMGAAREGEVREVGARPSPEPAGTVVST